MLFIVICAGLALGVALLLLRPLMRAGTGAEAAPQDVAFYKGQLRELERDLARGTLSPDEADRARAEIARRLLSADKAPAQRTAIAPHKATALMAALVGALVIGGGGALYWWAGAPGYPDLPLEARLAASEAAREARPSQAEVMADMPERPLPAAPEDYVAMVDQLRATAGARPDDLEGQQLLARHEAQLGHYDAAIAAQENVLRLKGDAATPDDKLMLVDLMVFQTRGYVSPEAEALARDIIAQDRGNVGARYYIGLLYDGTDRPDVAVRLWREIIESGSRDPHAEMARRMIEQAAERAGMRYALPDLPVPGPTAADIAAAQDMSAEDQDAMIRDMVARLNDRLAQQGGTAAEWARLIGALGVLGEAERAQAIWDEAQTRFADRPGELSEIRAAAVQAGVAP